MLSSMFNFIVVIFKIIYGLLSPLIWFIIISVAAISVTTFLYCLYWKKKGVTVTSDSNHKKPKRDGFFKRLFYKFPKQLAYDYMTRNPDDFPYKGVVIFTGMQGEGKTIGLVQFIMDIQAQYPDCKVITNLDYVDEDDELRHWKQLTDYNNGAHGVIVGMDETQNWFSSSQSRNFPPEMLQVITQNRKNRRIILGTSQSFYLLSKAIRSQCTEVRECRTFFNCLTIIKRRVPVLDCDGNVAEWHNLGRYFFVHDDKLRSAYDTYKVIENLSESGFQDTRPTVSVHFDS